MNAPPSFEYRELKIQDMDPLEARYCFRYSLEDSPLANSVRQFGILTPLLARPNGSRFGLISGFKRFYAALKLKIEKVPVLLLRDSLAEKNQIRLVFELNRNETFSPLDQAVAVARLISILGFSREEVRQEFLPLLGLAASAKVLEEYEKISKLDHEILEALSRGEIPFRGISDWADFSGEDQQVLWENCLQPFYYTSSELSEFASLMEDLIAKNNQPVGKILEHPDIRNLIKAAKSSNQKQKVEPLLAILKQLRFPKSYEARKEFREKLSRLKFKNPIQLLKSESMEEEGVELKIRLLKRDSFQKVLAELQEKAKEIEGLISS